MGKQHLEDSASNSDEDIPKKGKKGGVTKGGKSKRSNSYKKPPRKSPREDPSNL